MRPDAEHTKRFLQLLMSPGTCLELRIFRAAWSRNSGYIEPSDRYTSTFAGWYDRPDALIVDAGRCRGVSAFITLNPVKRDLLARSDNKLVKARTATTDNDIECLRWMYIDIDPVRPADISSTDAELALAVERRDRILLEFPEIRKAAIWGASGNGAFIFCQLPDYPNDAEHRSLVGRAIDAIAKRYSDDRVKIDTATRNPARVACLPGTFKTKGSNRPERPWRLARMDGNSNS